MRLYKISVVYSDGVTSSHYVAAQTTAEAEQTLSKALRYRYDRVIRISDQGEVFVGKDNAYLS